MVAVSLSQLLRNALSLVDRCVEDELSGTGLTARQYEMLCAIAEAPGSSQKYLALRTDMDRSTTASIIARLSDAGIIRRKRAPHDCRLMRVSLSPRGEALMKALEGVLLRAEERVFASLSADQKDEFKWLVAQKIVANAVWSDPTKENAGVSGAVAAERVTAQDA